MLASGVAGLDQDLALPSAVTGDAYESAAAALPADLTEAVQRFETSAVARAAFGPACTTTCWEWLATNATLHAPR